MGNFTPTPSAPTPFGTARIPLTKITRMILGQDNPRDPPVLKIPRRVNFGMGRKFGRDVAKRYGEGSEMLVFLGKRGRKTVQKVKNYGGSKILRIRAPYYLKYGRVLWESGLKTP